MLMLSKGIFLRLFPYLYGYSPFWCRKFHLERRPAALCSCMFTLPCFHNGIFVIVEQRSCVSDQSGSDLSYILGVIQAVFTYKAG